MRIRQNIFPNTYKDTLITAFVVIIIPIIYWFELFVVMPTFYKLWSPWYNFHFIMGTFILFNTTANFVYVILCDTSIKGIMLPTTSAENWRLCSVCECIAPPRSWHCSTCKTCIIKRDHHCHFTGCCIGHHNMRYFLMFVMYVFIATLYSTLYNIEFIMESLDMFTFKSVIKLIFPLVMVFLEWSIDQFYTFLVLLVLISCLFAGVLFYYHINMVVDGTVTHERKYGVNQYDLGAQENVRTVLGEKWYLIWVSPFIKSKLTHDGIYWTPKDTNKTK